MPSAVPQDQSPGQARPQGEDGQDVDLRVHARDKGKQRQMNDEDADVDAQSQASLDPPASPYPPMNNDEIETRRVEENLRRWEVTERKRRKAARESSQSVLATSSLLDDIARRANQIWPNRQNRHSSHNGLGAHTALQSQENFDSVPLDNIHDATSPSLSPSRTSSQDTLRENPFTNPSEAMSPFADPPNPESPTPTPSATRSSPFSKYLDPPSVSRRQPPVPKPLDLPKPRTPPPPVSSLPYASTSPAIAEEHPEVSDEKETRWWHDWLCGCGEGPDRGGEHQAGRTNPFE